MNYQAHYAELVRRAVGRVPDDSYTETHHILPRCVGGDDSADNLVELTAREHYTAHLMLVRMYQENKSLVYAAHMMTVDRYGHRVGNRKYEWLRKRHAEVTAEAKRGNTYALGRKHRPETIARIAAANIGNKSGVGRVFTPDVRAKIALSSRKPKSEKHKEAMAMAKKPGRAYSCGTPHIKGITQRLKTGAFVVRKRVDGERKYVGFYWSLAEARAALD